MSRSVERTAAYVGAAAVTFWPEERVGTGPRVLPSGSSRLCTFAVTSSSVS
jgi:hypothetical protein